MSKVRRFHDPTNEDKPPLSRCSSHDSLDSLNSSEKGNSKYEYGRITNTVRFIEQEGPHRGESNTIQLPSLITPISLYGKRIRYKIFFFFVNGKKEKILTVFFSLRYSILEYAPLLDSCDITMSGKKKNAFLDEIKLIKRKICDAFLFHF